MFSKLPNKSNGTSDNIPKKKRIGDMKIIKKVNFWFGKLPMFVKLFGSFVLVLLFLVTITIVSYKNINLLDDHVHTLGMKQMPKIEMIGNLKEEVTNIRMYAAMHAYEQSPETKKNIEGFIKVEAQKVHNNTKEMQQYNLTDDNKKALKEFDGNFEKYVGLLPSFYEKSGTNNFDEIHGQMGILTAFGSKTMISLDKFADSIEKRNKKIVTKAKQDAGNSSLQITIASIWTIFWGLLVGFLITTLIRRSVRKVVENVDTTTHSVTEIRKSIDQTAASAQVLDTSMIKANDSVSELVISIQQTAESTNITASGVEEVSAAIEQMSASINIVSESTGILTSSAEETSAAIQEMMASIEQVAMNIGSVDINVDEISAAIEEMSKSINDVSDNAKMLAERSEQTNESVEIMVKSTKQIADSVNKVNGLSNTVQNDAFEGAASLKETLEGMKEISEVITKASKVMETLGESSNEIGSIIEVIDNIADQTNLLALNAAIEAARAGEHGKGFAVVADEVRKLAESSVKATNEIATLIQGIQAETTVAMSAINNGAQKVKAGNQLANQTNSAITKITEGIALVTEEMKQIAIATEKQSKNSELFADSIETAMKRSAMMAYSTNEQALTAEEIVKGIINIKTQVEQISIATAEQAQGSFAIVEAVQSVTDQSNSVTNATKEQALTAEEIVRNINSMKDRVIQITEAANHQARYGKEISIVVENVRKQTEELNSGIEIQTKEVGEVVTSIKDVSRQIKKLK
ncbi:methyl-accepting chemotaxis protein [Bacillus sp. MM2020_4]|uniref:methyl-accepting chemotaxis protein n=2 Tax=Bacillaceae TaxID=186817 RepID=UPI001F61B64B|nr:methyl-accepting chemotaxis protein [Bacillus sp. MM2020_4]